MTETQKTIILDLLRAKEQEILNFDLDEPWSAETLDAITACVDFLNEATS